MNHGRNIFYGFLPLLISVAIFLFFNKQRFYYSKVVNNVASTAFSTYLITENYLVRPILWQFFSFHNIRNIWLVDFYGFLAVLLLFLGTFVIDKLRQKLFELSFISKVKSYIEKFILFAFNKILVIFNL